MKKILLSLVVLVGLCSISHGQCPGGVCYPPSSFSQPQSFGYSYAPQYTYSPQTFRSPSFYGNGCNGGGFTYSIPQQGYTYSAPSYPQPIIVEGPVINFSVPQSVPSYSPSPYLEVGSGYIPRRQYFHQTFVSNPWRTRQTTISIIR